MGDEVLGIRIKHRRGVIDRRIDEAVVRAGSRPAVTSFVAVRRERGGRRCLCRSCRSVSARLHVYRHCFAPLPRDWRSRQPLDLKARSFSDASDWTAGHRPSAPDAGLWRAPHAERPGHETYSYGIRHCNGACVRHASGMGAVRPSKRSRTAASSFAAPTARWPASACPIRRAIGPASTSISAAPSRRRFSTIRPRSNSCP